MVTPSLFGFIVADDPIHCAREVLGHTEAVSVGGVSGYLHFPEYPRQPNMDDPAGRLLIAPAIARGWKGIRTEGDDWGKVMATPVGRCDVFVMLLSFELDSGALGSRAKTVKEHFSAWSAHFVAYLELLTKQRKADGIIFEHDDLRLDLFCWKDDKTSYDPTDGMFPGRFQMNLKTDAQALTRSQLTQICAYSSEARQPALEYRVQLRAYRALRKRNYGSAITEAATAAEIALTRAIEQQLRLLGVSFGAELLKKYGMLSDRLKLARTVGVHVPEEDFQAQLIQPRNHVIHRAPFAESSEAERAVSCVDRLLHAICPDLREPAAPPST